MLRRAPSVEGAATTLSPPRRPSRPRERFTCFPLSERSGRFGSGTLFGATLLRSARPLPGLACRGRELARALGLAFGLFQALARALELIFGDAYTLLGDIRLQPRPRERFGRGALFAACLLHPGPAKRKTRSLTQAPARFHPG